MIDVAACEWSTVVFVEPETAAGRALSGRLDGRVEYLDEPALAGPLARLDEA
jgi:hypothetical protein